MRSLSLGIIQTMHEKALSDDKLAEEIKRKKRQAVGELYSPYYHLAYFSAYQITGQAQEAEDAASDVFAALIENPELLEDGKDVKAYLFQAAKNNAIHYVNWKRKDHDEIEEGLTASPEEKKYSVSDRAVAFLKSVLSEAELSVYVLHAAYSYTFKEIGLSLGLSEDAVSSLYFRAKEKIRKAPRPTDLGD
jgi:RNA polymerase sigma factor (sigma-70 family)